MPNFNYKPLSLSTDPGEVLAEMTERYLRGQQRLGRAPASTGVTRPMPTIRNASDARAAIDAWTSEHKLAYGGYAADSRDTPVQESYAQRRWDFLSREEAVRESAYDDHTGKPVGAGKPKGRVTIGVGFNMDRPDSRQVFAKVLGIQGSAYDQIYYGKSGLSQTQVRKLFDFAADEAEGHVQRKIGNVPLREHQRLALVSLAYNSPELIGPRLSSAVREGNHQAIAHEVLNNSGAIKNPALKGRREREAMMFFGHTNVAAVQDGFMKTSHSDPAERKKALEAKGRGLWMPMVHDQKDIRVTSGSDEPGMIRPPTTEDKMPEVPATKPNLQV